MPTPKKQDQVEEIKDRLSRCTIAVTTGYQGLAASQMTELRRRLSEQGIEFKVVKNTLTLRAAEDLGMEGLGDVLKGPTGVAFGYGEVTTVAKGINSYITTTRQPLVIYGALMGDIVLTADQVRTLALLPSRDELVARLMGQLQAPIAMLVNVLSAPMRGLVVALQRIAERGEGLEAAEVSSVVTDAEPEEAPLAVADAEPEEPSLAVADAEPEQASPAATDTEPEQASLAVADGEPEEAAPAVADGEPEEAFLTVADGEPEEAALAVADAEPDEAAHEATDLKTEESA